MRINDTVIKVVFISMTNFGRSGQKCTHMSTYLRCNSVLDAHFYPALTPHPPSSPVIM